MAGSIDLGLALLAIQWTLFALSSLVVGMRVYVRICFLRSRLNAADWVMLGALLFETVSTSISTFCIIHGMGKHIFTIPYTDARLAIKYNFILTVFNLGAPMLGRLSFTIFLLGLLPKQAKLQRLSLWIVNVVQISSVAITMIQLFSQCGSHVSALWDSGGAWPDFCQSRDVAKIIGYVTASFYAACDLYLTILPVMFIWKLKMELRMKRALIAVLCLSGVAFIGSVARVCLLMYLQQPDFTWYMTFLVMCVFIESNIVIVCASMPVLRALWTRRSLRTTRQEEYDLEDSDRMRTNTKAHSFTVSAGRSGPGRGSRLSQGLPKFSARRDPMAIDDGTSEEYILENGMTTPRTQDIAKMTQVKVSFGQSGSGSASDEKVDQQVVQKSW